MYSNNLCAFVQHFWNKETKSLGLDLNHEILKACVVTHGGQIVNETIKAAYGGAAQFVICHLSFFISPCPAVRFLDRFVYDLAAMRYHRGLKDFVIEIQTEALGLFVPKVLHKGAKVI